MTGQGFQRNRFDGASRSRHVQSVRPSVESADSRFNRSSGSPSSRMVTSPYATPYDTPYATMHSVSRKVWKPPKRRGARIWRVVFWVSLAVLIFSLGALGFIGYSYWKGQNTYDDLADQAFAVSDIEGATPADFSIDWQKLQAINPDVVAWIYLPGTEISYPVVHREDDDEYYLTHNFNNESAQFGAEYGALMLSGSNQADFSDQNNVIYGHNMANGSMFALLGRFWDSDTFNRHRVIYLFTPQGNYLLNPFAVVRVHETEVDVVVPNFESAEEFAAFIQDKLDTSIVSAQPPVPLANELDRVITLSTCDGDDATYRYLTFCNIVEFLSAEQIAANDADVTALDNDVNERLR